MSRFLDPVPLLLGGLVGAIVGGIASWTIEGRVDWALVVALLVATLVTSLAMLIGAGPTRGMGWGDYGVHAHPGPRRWQFAGGRGPIGPFVPPTPVAGSESVPPWSGVARPFDRFDDGAKLVLAFAQDEANRFGHDYIGTEHLLLGLMRHSEGVGARALVALGVDLAKCRTAVQFIIGTGQMPTAPADMTLSPRSKRVIELAVDEAGKLGHPRVGSGHLLLGIVREGEGIASGILQSLGVHFDAVRQKVLELMAPPPPQAPPAPPGA